MIVVGARFRALAAARAALRAIRTSVVVEPGDVAVRPLGTTTYEAPGEQFLLAGRFEADDVSDVISVLHAHGGRVIERRDDAPHATSIPAALPRSSARLRERPAGRDQERGSRRQKRLRRPAPPRRVRTALRRRTEADRQ